MLDLLRLFVNIIPGEDEISSPLFVSSSFTFQEFMGQVFLFSIESFFGQFFYLQSVLRKSSKNERPS